MPTATFTIFRDDAPQSPSRSGTVAEPQSSPFRVVVHHPGPQLIFNAEKENINPMTGVRSNIDHTKKKRKTDVLATKLHVPPPYKKKKELKEKDKEGKESKKRATAAPSTAVPKPKVSPEKKKGKRVLGARRNGGGIGPSRQRRSPSLPCVAEEPEAPQPPLSQTQVDARCYELTVLPLADVSQAYEEAPRLEHLLSTTEDEKDVPAMEPASLPLTPGSPELQRIVREKTPELKDEAARAASPEPEQAKIVVPFFPEDAFDVFSTPDRKRIYHTFTFSSPSPAGKRYAASREHINDRFSDIIDFELIH